MVPRTLLMGLNTNNTSPKSTRVVGVAALYLSARVIGGVYHCLLIMIAKLLPSSIYVQSYHKFVNDKSKIMSWFFWIQITHTVLSATSTTYTGQVGSTVRLSWRLCGSVWPSAFMAWRRPLLLMMIIQNVSKNINVIIEKIELIVLLVF